MDGTSSQFNGFVNLENNLRLFGDTLKISREAISPRKSLRKISEELGVRESSVSSWERGISFPGDDISIESIAKAYQLDDIEFLRTTLNTGKNSRGAQRSTRRSLHDSASSESTLDFPAKSGRGQIRNANKKYY